MRSIMTRALMTGTMILSGATAAQATDLNFTLKGLFDISLGGQEFDGLQLTLDGIGHSPLGLTTSQGFPFISFTTLNAIVPGSGTFPVPNSIIFYFDPSGSPTAGESGFIDTSTGKKVLTLNSGAFAGYDATTSLTATGLTFGSADGFDTPFGTAQVISAEQLTLTTVAPSVPEPASWAMLVGGFGLIGGVMRARRSNLAFAA